MTPNTRRSTTVVQKKVLGVPAMDTKGAAVGLRG